MAHHFINFIFCSTLPLPQIRLLQGEIPCLAELHTSQFEPQRLFHQSSARTRKSGKGQLLDPRPNGRRYVRQWKLSSPTETIQARQHESASFVASIFIALRSSVRTLLDPKTSPSSRSHHWRPSWTVSISSHVELQQSVVARTRNELSGQWRQPWNIRDS